MCKPILTGSRSSMLKQHHEGTGQVEGRSQPIMDTLGVAIGRGRLGLIADGRPGRQKVNNELPFGDWGRLMRESEQISFCSCGNKAWIMCPHVPRKVVVELWGGLPQSPLTGVIYEPESACHSSWHNYACLLLTELTCFEIKWQDGILKVI